MNSQTFKNKFVIYLALVIFLILIFLPVIFYILKLGNNELSNNISDWASFADYLGGTINTIISFTSLIILTIITILVSNQSNSENKKTNLLLKRIESYDKLVQLLPRLIIAVQEMKVSSGAIAERLKNKIIPESDIKEFAEHSIVISEIFSMVVTFQLQYGHLYKYDFDSNDFHKLIDLSKEINENYVQVKQKLLLQQNDYPELPGKKVNEFIILFHKILNQLKTELY